MWAQAPGIQCSELADVSALGSGLEKLQGLTSLNLGFRYCEQLSYNLQEDFESKADFVAALRDRVRTESGGDTESLTESGGEMEKVRTAQQS